MTSSSPQDQYLQAVRHGQEAMTTAMRAWSDAVQRMWTSGMAAGGAASTPPPAEVVIDQVFDFAQQILNAQRELAKQMVRAAQSAQQATRTTSTGT